jgi:hypothetical protein
MNTDIALSRRRLLASFPAVAATAVPAAATALSGLPAAIPPHLDGRKIEGLAEMLAMLENMPPDEANKILDFLARAIGQARHDLAADADLMALKPTFDQMFDNWWTRWEDSMEHSRAVDAAVQERHPNCHGMRGGALSPLTLTALNLGHG